MANPNFDDLSKEEQEAVKLYRQLDAEGKEILMDFLLKNAEYGEEIETDLPDFNE